MSEKCEHEDFIENLATGGWGCLKCHVALTAGELVLFEKLCAIEKLIATGSFQGDDSVKVDRTVIDFDRCWKCGRHSHGGIMECTEAPCGLLVGPV